MTHKRLTLSLVSSLLLLALATPALAQWKWRDAEGRVQYSDRPPPPGVAEKDILQRPPGAVLRITPVVPGAPANAAAPAAASAPLPARGASAELSSREKLEQERAQQEAKKRAEIRAENCRQAQNQLRILESGVRVSRTNAKGENEVLGDQGRAEEMSRARTVIAAECKAP